jgi:hypothetical protein
MSKKKSINMHKFYCLMQLLQDNLDDLEVTTPRMKFLKDSLSEFCEILNNECANTYTIQKTTYFQELTNKIDTLMRKSFNPEM